MYAYVCEFYITNGFIGNRNAINFQGIITLQLDLIAR